MILVVGLSPAWQRTLVFPALVPGKVNRAVRVGEMASGKGVNVARVVIQFGAPVRLLTIAGGTYGRQLVASMKTQRLPVNVVRVDAETRVCQTLIAGETMTELVEEAGELSRAEVAEVAAQFQRELRRAKLVVLTGSVPPGCGEDFYARLIRRATQPVLVDAQRTQLLNAVCAKPFAVKVNRDELAAVPALRRDSVEWLVVSDGARRVTVHHGRERFTVLPPRVRAVNTIGSGDAMMAGIAVALLRGRAMPEAVRFGVACGAANAVTSEPGHIRPADVRRFKRMLDKPVVGR